LQNSVRGSDFRRGIDVIQRIEELKRLGVGCLIGRAEDRFLWMFYFIPIRTSLIADSQEVDVLEGGALALCSSQTHLVAFSFGPNGRTILGMG
jgi:hypothetical protein